MNPVNTLNSDPMAGGPATMSSSSSPRIDPPPADLALGPAPLQRVERSLVARLVAHLGGRAVLVDRAAGETPPTVASGVHVLEVLDPRAYAAVVRRGSAGLGEAWFRGWWRTDDLVGVLRLFIDHLDGVDLHRSRVHETMRPVLDPLRRLRRPDRLRDRRNVRAHYDLGNDFFAAFLDETMTYSSAVFESADASLADASHAKLDRLCRKLGVQAGHRVVEIGTGWGSFALRAAGVHGAHVTTTTVSAAQARLARKRIADAGLGDRIDLRELDYRDLRGRFDRLVSIEMIEAVDWRDVPTFFRTCASLLAPDGLMGLQAIVIGDRRWSRARVTTDFIKRWVFPGGSLPSITSITHAATAASDLRIVDLEDLGYHYAETLRRWRDALHRRWNDLPALGVGDELARLWDFYLAYCEAAFLERHVSVVQLVLAREQWRPAGLSLRPV